MCRKDTLKKSLRASWAGARLASIRLCFLSWLAIRPAVFLKHHGFGQLLEATVAEASSFRSWASSSKLYNDAARIVRSTVKEDKVAFLDALAAQANQAAQRGDDSGPLQRYAHPARLKGLCETERLGRWRELLSATGTSVCRSSWGAAGTASAGPPPGSRARARPRGTPRTRTSRTASTRRLPGCGHKRGTVSNANTRALWL